MTTKKRIETVRVLVSGHPGLTGSPELTAIIGELNRVGAAAKVPKYNGWLLGVLHTTRALDTTLRELLRHKGWLDPLKQGLGAYFAALRNHSILTTGETDSWKRSIVDKRNRYMHVAGAMPSQLENDAILSEMEACLTIVLGRT